LLLALGYLLGLPYLPWALLLGGLSLWLVVWASRRIWRRLWPERAEKDWLAGIILALSWPLVWSAASGMETLLFTALGLVLVGEWVGDEENNSASDRAVSRKRSPLILGFLSGLLILVRPDGLVLLLLLTLGLLFDGRGVKNGIKPAAIFLGTAILPLLPYFAFNLWSSNSIWPNTFYAKQTEYALLLEDSIITRFIRLLFFSLGGPERGWRGMSGAHLLLLPGLAAALWLALRSDWHTRQFNRLLPFLWAGGHIALYAWRLPVTYQHGRYLLPALPIWILSGLAGWQWLLTRFGSRRRGFFWRQVVSLTFVVLLLAFLFLGAQSYSTDVAFIESEMVRVAHWLDDNTPQDALLAAHDIGAIGFFTERPLLDLAGLITPEIIPFLADDQGMAHYVLDSGADYLVTAPGWPYEQLTRREGVVLVYDTDYTWTRENELNNTAVFALNLP
jgi:hypothetical protein